MRWWMSLLGVVVSICVWSQPVWAQPWVRVSPVVCTDGTAATIAPISETFSGAGSRRVIVAVTSKKAYILAFWLRTDTTAVSIKFTQGSGATCSSGIADLTGLLLTFSAANQTVDSAQLNPPWVSASAVDVCLYSSLAATLSGEISYCVQ